MKRIFLSVGCVASLALFGFGCSSASTSSSTATSTDPVAMAQKIVFLPNDSFDINQSLIGGKDGTKHVTMTRFAPAHFAALNWTATTEQETAASRQAREAYQKQLLDKRQVRDLLNPPQVEMEDIVTTGTVTNINLSQSSNLLPPSYWEAFRTMDALNQKTGIWLSDNTFLELSKTSTTILNIGLLDEAANRMLKDAKDLKAAYDKFKSNAQTQLEHKDLTLVEAEKTFIEWPLTINGKEVKVSAIRGKNGFGEFVVLNNRQNPLLLKLTINPLAFGAAEAAGGSVDVSKLFGFQVDHLTVGVLNL